jgi:hypothetical protein
LTCRHQAGPPVKGQCLNIRPFGELYTNIFRILSENL